MNIWTLYGLILLIGASQGVILGIILWRNTSQPKTANRFLAVILFFFAYRLMAEALRTYDIGGIDSWLYYVLLEYNWVYGCLIYFFVISYFNPEFSLNRRTWIHFVPVLCEFLFSTFIKAQNLFWDGSRESLSWLGYHGYRVWMHTPFQFIVASILMLSYVYAGRRFLNGNGLPSHIVPKPESKVRIQRILVAYQLFAVGALLLSLLDYVGFNYAFNPFYKYPVYVGMSIITYWLGLEGFAHRNEQPYVFKAVVEPQQQLAWKPVLDKLDKLMHENQLYKNPKISLAVLARELDISPHHLTQILNRGLEKSVNDYVNSFRVTEVKRLLQNRKFDHYTLLAIGMEAGFNSKASFNRIVKKCTGMSPRELREQFNAS